MQEQVLEEIWERLKLRTFSVSFGGVEMELIKKEDLLSVLSDYVDIECEQQTTQTA